MADETGLTKTRSGRTVRSSRQLRADRGKGSPREGCSKRQDQEQRDAGFCKPNDIADVLESDGVIYGGAEQVVKRRRNQRSLVVKIKRLVPD
jgi:hypothetical protein